MRPEFQSSIDRIADRARSRYRQVLGDARSQTVEAANRVETGKRPVRRLETLGIELSKISHRATTGVLKSQARLVEHQIDALAGRLHAAARAESLRGLLRDQLRLVPENASRFIDDTRETVRVVRDAGSEVKSLLADSNESAPAKAPTKKSAAKKSAAKKSSAKKSPRGAARVAKVSRNRAQVAKRTAKKASKKKTRAASKTPRRATKKAGA